MGLNEEDIKISVVLPLYNKEKSIHRTIKSILEQKFLPQEILVINDGSTDNSKNEVKKFFDNRIRIIDTINGGVSSARNRGIMEAKCEYIAFIDGDDIWYSDFLLEQKQLILDFPSAKMWGVNYAFVKNNIATPCISGLTDNYRGIVKNYFGTKHNDLFCSSSVVVKRDTFETTGLFDTRISYSEDLDMWYRIIFHFDVVFYDKVLSCYIQDAENRHGHDLGLKFDLKKFMPYYIDKYQTYFDQDKIFSSFINNLFAANLLMYGYHFGSNIDRENSKHVIKHLRFNDIHFKYRLIFKSPKLIGLIVYKIVGLKKRLQRLMK